jgi:hypothetical protein
VAQWAGGYSGNTHASRVRDTETLLREAIAALRGASTAPSVRTKAKAVRQFARKLLLARVRLMKAQMAALPGGTPASKRRLALQERLASTQARGVTGILDEFKVTGAIDL